MTTTPTDAPVGAGLSSADRVAVIAGSGRLPAELTEGLAARGHTPLLVLVQGEADRAAELEGYPREWLAIEGLGLLIPLLRRYGITHAVMAGGIARRPHWRKVKVTFGMLKYLPTIIRKLGSGDNAALSALVGVLEAEGIRVLGAHQILPDLLAPEGPLGALRPSARDQRDLDAALEAALTLGRLDIGQGAVAVGGRVIAVEGIEGTDGLLERVAALRPHGRIATFTGGALVKCAKPQQEVRADLPTIGPATVDAAHKAGLAGIGVEAGRSIVLEAAEVARRADTLGLFVVGLTGRRS